MFYSGYILICNNLTVWNKSILQPIVVKFCFFYRKNSLLHCYLLLLSLTILPSAISITLLHFAAISLSWITMIIVLLDSFIFSKTDIISSVVLLSSAPVGSSASITDGLLTIARAIAARCFCPHDSLLQCLSALLFRPVQALFVLFFFYLWACFLQNQEGALPSFTGQVTEGVLFGTGDCWADTMKKAVPFIRTLPHHLQTSQGARVAPQRCPIWLQI